MPLKDLKWARNHTYNINFWVKGTSTGDKYSYKELDITVCSNDSLAVTNSYQQLAVIQPRFVTNV